MLALRRALNVLFDTMCPRYTGPRPYDGRRAMQALVDALRPEYSGPRPYDAQPWQPPTPEFEKGQAVRVILNDRNRTAREGVVERSVWHSKEGRHCYFLRDHRGKPVKKRYFADDLEPATSGEAR